MRGLRPGGGAAGEERPAEVSSCCATSCSCQLSLRRAEILAAHNSIPALMSGWRAEEALAAARTKLRLTRGLGDQLATLLPSALLELHEMSSLAQVRQWKTTLPPVHVCCVVRRCWAARGRRPRTAWRRRGSCPRCSAPASRTCASRSCSRYSGSACSSRPAGGSRREIARIPE